MTNRGRGEGIISRKVGEEKREGQAEVKQAERRAREWKEKTEAEKV